MTFFVTQLPAKGRAKKILNSLLLPFFRPALQVSLMVLCLSGLGQAQEPDDMSAIWQESYRLAENGFDLLAAEKYSAALELFQQAAAQGNFHAFRGLSKMYHQGLGVAADGKQARDLERQGFEACLQAATEGDPLAQVTLADLYTAGQGVAKDAKKAGDLYRIGAEGLRRAAAQNNRAAIVRLAFMYYEGAGIQGNRETGLALYRQGAELGSARAQYQLGIHYVNNPSEDLGPGEPLRWFLLAARANNRFGLMARKQLQEGHYWEDLVNDQIRWSLEAGDREAAIKQAELALEVSLVAFGDSHRNTLKSREILSGLLGR